MFIYALLTIHVFSHASHRSRRALAKYDELGFIPIYTPSCSSHYSSVEHLWSALKLHTINFFGQLSLQKVKLTNEDLSAAIDVAFSRIGLEARY